jgi:hypothetical protein
MNTDEITNEVLGRWERSPRRLENSKNCIWACAMRLMDAGDPDAPAHISMVGNRIGLPEREINSAIRNAAKRTGWQEPKPEPKPEPRSDVAEIDDDDEFAWNAAGDAAWKNTSEAQPQRCEVPKHLDIHGWPEDHPECAQCTVVDAWFATHRYSQRWMYWVETQAA